MSRHNDKALAVNAEMIETEAVEHLESLQVRGTLQIVIPTPTEAMHLMHKSLLGIEKKVDMQGEHLQQIVNENIEKVDSLSILYDIQTVLNRCIREKSASDDFMKTKEMAQNLSVSTSFLEKNMDVIFHDGTHFYRNGDARLLRWDIPAMHNWVKGGNNNADNSLLNKLLD